MAIPFRRARNLGFGLMILLLVAIGLIPSTIIKRISEPNKRVSKELTILTEIVTIESTLEEATKYFDNLTEIQDRNVKEFAGIINDMITCVNKLENSVDEQGSKILRDFLTNVKKFKTASIALIREEEYDPTGSSIGSLKKMSLDAETQSRRALTNLTDNVYRNIQDARKNMNAIIKGSQTFSLAGLVAGIIIGLITAYVMAKAMTRPIHQLTEGTQIIAEGNLDHKVKVEFNDEIGQLADSFNTMVQDLKASTVSRNELIKEIAERKKVQERLENAIKQLNSTTSQLVQSEKMTALGELTSGIAHELNQPLNVMKIISQSAMKDIQHRRYTPKNIKEDLPEIIQQIDKMSDIIIHMMTLSKRKEEKLASEEFSINTPVENAFKLIGEQLKTEGIAVDLQLTPDLPNIIGDPLEIEHALLNIITNARNALNETGREKKQLGVKSYIQENKASVCVDITDNGKGIPSSDQEKIFQPFFTTVSAIKPDGIPVTGKGLGLSIARKIIEDHNGTIEVESKVGEGSTFRTVLPYTTTPA